MVITVASFKGGVAKSTTAVHIAYELARDAKTLLVDGDPNRSASRWTGRGTSLPFPICDEAEGILFARSGEYEHIVIDTKARPEPADLRSLARGCQMLVLPCTPDDLSIDAMLRTVEEIRKAGATAFRVLLTIVPPRPDQDGRKARESLTKAGIPLFSTQIPRSVAYRRCMQTGQVVHSLEYGEVTEEIVALVEEQLAVKADQRPVIQTPERPVVKTSRGFIGRRLVQTNVTTAV